MNLQSVPLEDLPGTRSDTIKRMKAVGIQTLWDLLQYTPFRYEDYSRITPIAKLKEGVPVTIQGTVSDTRVIHTRSRMSIQKIVVQDDSGSIEITWFNQPFILTMLKKGLSVSIAGSAKQFGRNLTFEPKEYEIIKPGVPLRHTGRIVPVYPAKYGLSSRTIREKIQLVFEHFVADGNLDEMLPSGICKKYGLVDEMSALKTIHTPQSLEEKANALYRLAFNELFMIQLSSYLVKEQWKKETVGTALDVTSKKNKDKIADFIKKLPFELTNAQKKVTKHILDDISKTTPMNRFVQGDVGSGKTAVAAIGAYATWINGYQTLIMAPTEILAQQHYATISKMLKDYPVQVGIQTRTQKITKGKYPVWDYDIIIGTHALLTQKVSFEKVGLVIIDEQHRFGVRQRAVLKQKGFNPHLLTMTATPIPRTVALTLYGELDLSVIDEMPKGRLAIKTAVIPETKREKAYSWIQKQITEKGVQAYIICPLIEESESETMKSVRAANKEYEHLKKTVFKNYNVALIHGKMKPKEKEEVMDAFKEKKYDVLISTSVVEVGIDVPNATIMIIEGAERYGLAQLHQLRGRVGRGEIQSYCFLFTTTQEAMNSRRLSFFSQTNSGMRLAEYDLNQRGAGQLYGTQQSGENDLRFAEFSDLPLIEKTKSAAQEFIKQYSLDSYPELQRRMEQWRTDQIAKD